MPPHVTRVSPGSRAALRTFAVLLIVGGLAMLVGGFAASAQSGKDLDQGPPVTSMVVFMVGGLALGFGVWLAKLAFVGPVAGVLATETEGAVEVAAGAVGRGLGQGFGPRAAPAAVVKVKCRGCGYLESEDARFCSQCRAAL